MDYIDTLKTNYMKAYHVGHTGKVLNHADEALEADYYIDSWLKALKKVTVYSNYIDNGIVAPTPVAVFEPGEIVGRVYSYKLYNGSIWWQLDDPQNKHFGWVKHEKGLFDPKTALDSSSQKVHDSELAALQAKIDNDPLDKLGQAGMDILSGAGGVISGAGKTLASFGANLHWIVLAILLGVMGYIVFNFKKL